MQNEKTEAVLIEGRNPVWEAIKAQRPMEKLYVAKTIDQQSVARILAAARRMKIKIEWVPKERLDAFTTTGKHQGLIAVASVHEYADLDEELTRIQASGEDPFIVLLDEIMDPYNLGAIIRSAGCAGAHLVVITQRHSVGLTGAVERASAGAIEHVPVCRVVNMAQCVENLADRGIRCVAAVPGGKSLWQSDLDGPLALVIGNEGNGIRHLVQQRCQDVVGLPMKGKLDSLNASVAAGILMYEVFRQRLGQ